MSHYSRKNKIIHKNTFSNQNNWKKPLFPKCIRRTSETIRDLVTFPENIRRTSDRIRDLEKSSFQNFRKSKQVVPQKCRGIVPTSVLYFPPLKCFNLLQLLFHLNFHSNFSWCLGGVLGGSCGCLGGIGVASRGFGTPAAIRPPKMNSRTMRGSSLDRSGTSKLEPRIETET